MKPLPDDLAFTLTGAGPGVRGVETLRAWRAGRAVGSLSFSFTLGTMIWVHYLEVATTERRQGIATALWTEMERRYPGFTFERGGYTADGAALAKARGRE